MINIDEETKIKIEEKDSKILVTIKVKKEYSKYLLLSFELDSGTADKVISKLVASSSKICIKKTALRFVKSQKLFAIVNIAKSGAIYMTTK